MKLLKKYKPEKTTENIHDEENTLLSVFDISIEHPRNWKIIFSPKTPPDYSSGFIRLENFIPRKGAQVSVSVNWQKSESDNESFAFNYCRKIKEEYAKHLKKKPYTLEESEIIDFRGGKAAYIVTEYKAGLGLIRKSGDIPVRTIQLAFYDEGTKRAVVSSVLGLPELVRNREDFLKKLVFSVNSVKYSV